MPDTTEKRHHFNPNRTGIGITSVQTRQCFSPGKAGQKLLSRHGRKKAPLLSRQCRTWHYFSPDKAVLHSRQGRTKTLIQTRHYKAVLQSREGRTKNFNPDKAGQGSPSVQTRQIKKF
jgi:hypothetical protein